MFICGRKLGSATPGTLGRLRFTVQGVVALVAVQVAEREVVGHLFGEGVFPVQTLNGSVLRVRGTRRRKSDGQVASGIHAGILPPVGVVEVVVVAQVEIDAPELHVLAVGQRALSGMGTK